MSMSDSPRNELCRQLNYHLERRAMAYDTIWRNPTEARLAEGNKRGAQEEEAIENFIRVWVYKDLIEKFKTLSAYDDVGHFDHTGVMGVVEYLQNEVQRMTNEG